MGTQISLPAHTHSLQSGKSQPDNAYSYDGDVYYDAASDLQPDWRQIPDDVMRLIIQRLDVTDRTRICLVCKPWRILSMEKEIPVPPQFPLLMLSPTPNQSSIWSMMFSRRKQQQVISFFDRIQRKIHNYCLPKSVEGGWCFGSSRGWLFIAKGSKKNPQVFLLNPMSAKVIPLPSITTIPTYYQHLEEEKDAYNFSYFINKLDLYFLEEDEDLPCNCTVVAILNQGEVLATCKPYDDKWIAIQSEDMFIDMSFHKGTLYVLFSPFGYDDNTIIDLNLGTIPIKLVLHACHVSVEKVNLAVYDFKGAYAVESITRNGLSNSYLVESRGELLQIVMYFDVLQTKITLNNDGGCGGGDDNADVFEYLQATECEVYKVVDRDGKFEEMRRMDCLEDDQVLFVGGVGSSVSVSAKDFEGIKGNCIHFLDDTDYRNCSSFDPFVARESGIFWLKDGKITRGYPSRKCPAPFSWFTPHLDFPCTS